MLNIISARDAEILYKKSKAKGYRFWRDIYYDAGEYAKTYVEDVNKLISESIEKDITNIIFIIPNSDLKVFSEIIPQKDWDDYSDKVAYLKKFIIRGDEISLRPFQIYFARLMSAYILKDELNTKNYKSIIVTKLRREDNSDYIIIQFSLGINYDLFDNLGYQVNCT